jgi:spectinomycin phosphotransferase
MFSQYKSLAFIQMKPIQEPQIIAILQKYYGITIQTIHRFPGGADINAFVYKADAKLNSYFVKLKYGHYNKINLSIVNLLHNANISEIIFPILTCEGNLFQHDTDFSVIVYPFIPASNGFVQKLTTNQWKNLGQALRKIHEISIPDFIAQQIRKENYSNKWREIVRSFYTKIEPVVSDDKITTEFKLYFTANIDKINRLVDSAERLSKNIAPDENYVLCHSDIHAGNILITDDSIYIIDWDEPILAPKERDLMFIGGGVGSVWNNPQEVDYFYAGYGKTNINKAILAYYRCERIIEDIAEYGQDLLGPNKNYQSRNEMLHHFKMMFDKNGVVDVAFATFETY